MSDIQRSKLPSVTKLDAARRQLEFAIEAHFEGRDPFAIHSVVAAAFGILRGLANRAGTVRAHEALKDHIRPGMEREYWAYMNRASNFLKHADRDPDESLEGINEEINDPSIFMAALYYTDLKGSATGAISVYTWWYAALHPSVLTDEFRAEIERRVAPGAEIQQLRRLPRDLHLKAGLELLKLARRGGIPWATSHGS